MRRKRIKAAKKAKLAKIQQIQSQIKSQEEAGQTHNDNRVREMETQDIDATIKVNLKKVNKSLMKKDDRFKDVIGKITKIKRKADNVKQKLEKKVEIVGKKKRKINPPGNKLLLNE